MAKLYGLGASVVILGALFKINHYPGADIMLIIGLGTEAAIFFFSAFEPPYVEPDWSLVYPELAGLYHGEGDGPRRKASEELDAMLNEAKIDQSLITRLGDGLRSLSDNTAKLRDISDAATATNEYVENVKGASKSASELTSSYNMAADALQKDASVSQEYNNSIKSASQNASLLSDSYKQAAESLKSDVNVTDEFTSSIREAMKSANFLAEQYTKSAEVLQNSAASLDFSKVDGGDYGEQLQKISGNLAALNSVYELQLQSSNEQIEAAAKVRETMSDFLSTLKDSADMMQTYKEQMNSLTERVAALNNIYGGMLTAMNAGPAR